MANPRVIIPTRVPDGAWVLPTDVPVHVSVHTPVPTPAALATGVPVLVRVQTEIPRPTSVPTEIPEYFTLNIGTLKGLGEISAAVTSVLMESASELVGRGQITVDIIGVVLDGALAGVRGAGRVSATVTLKLPGVNNLRGLGYISAAVSMTLQSSGLLTAKGQISAAAAQILPAALPLGGKGQISASVESMSMAYPGLFYGIGSLEGSAVGIGVNHNCDSTANLDTTSTGSGISSSGGQIVWAGSSDGYATSLISQAKALTTDQYVRAVVGSSVTARAAAAIFHADVGLTSYYAVNYFSTNVQLIKTSGRWVQNAYTTIGSAGAGVAAGDVIEGWNIGDRFTITKNGVVVVSVTVAGSTRGRAYNRGGLGTWRSSFVSCTATADLTFGDAVTYGKS